MTTTTDEALGDYGRGECKMCERHADTITALQQQVERLGEVREHLQNAVSELDAYAGDSDLSHFESDDEWRDADPVTWSISQVSKAMQLLPLPEQPENSEP